MDEKEGMVYEGKNFYAITHAYYHLLFTVQAMTGPQRAQVTNVRFIYSSTMNWTDFFKKGCTRKDTVIHDWPDGEVSWIDIFKWEHPIP